MKKTSDTKERIVESAWKLFYEQGFENTTIEDIVFESHTSKGSFYHYFQSKDDLLGSLSDLFDKKYEELEKTIDYDKSCAEILFNLNQQLFKMVEDEIDIELLSRLFSTQLTTNQKKLLDKKRLYYRLLRKIVIKGQEKGEISNEQSAKEIVKLYAMLERGMMYDWCLSDGDYSLEKSAQFVMSVFLNSISNSK